MKKFFTSERLKAIFSRSNSNSASFNCFSMVSNASFLYAEESTESFNNLQKLFKMVNKFEKCLKILKNSLNKKCKKVNKSCRKLSKITNNW